MTTAKKTTSSRTRKAPSTRPSLTPKTTRKTEQKRDDAADFGMRVTLDGEIYEVRLSDVTSDLVRELRRKAGYGFNGLLKELSEDPDIDFIAAFVWLARRVAGDDVDFDDVVVNHGQLQQDDFDAVPVGGEDEHQGPEA